MKTETIDLTVRDIDKDVAMLAKKVSKDCGVAWGFLLTKALEKVLTEVVSARSIEEIIIIKVVK